MTDRLPHRVPTPCIGVCSTGIGDDVCRGCKRYAHEVIHWNSYSDEQKLLIDQRLEHFLTQVVAAKLSIFDVALLSVRLNERNIRHGAAKDPYVWVFQLLRAGASQIDDCRAYGFELAPFCADMALADLRDQIDREFFILSEAHYQRYFKAPSKFAHDGETHKAEALDAH